MSEQHSLIRPAHLIATDADEADAITQAIGDEGDLEKAREQAATDRAATLRQRLSANSRRNARSFDAMEFALALNDVSLADFVPTMAWHENAASDKQLALLAKFGFDPNTILCKGHAAAILDKLFLRRDLGLASPKQVRWLRKLGHAHPELATFEEARAFLDTRWKTNREDEPAAA